MTECFTKMQPTCDCEQSLLHPVQIPVVAVFTSRSWYRAILDGIYGSDQPINVYGRKVKDTILAHGISLGTSMDKGEG